MHYFSTLFIKIKLRNSASCWHLLQEYTTIQGPLNVKHYVTSHVLLSWKYF